MADNLASGLTGSMKELKKMAMILGAIYVALIGLWIVVGALNHQAQTGNLPVTTATLTALNTTETAFGTAVTTVTAAIGIILGFIALVVIFKILKGFLGGNKKSDGIVGEY